MVDQKRIDELEKELAQLKAEAKKFNALPQEYQLAEYMHSKLCHSNHIDMCGWHYETWDNPGYSRKNYLEKAKKALKIADGETIKKIINIL